MSVDYELIVFDWDGTLMDSAGHITYCMRLALKDMGIPSKPDQELQQVIGLGLMEAVMALVPGHNNDFYEALTEAYRQHWLNSPPGLTHFFKGIPGMLSQLHAADICMAVATGKSRRGLDKQFLEENVGHLFAASRCADETASKPAPDMLLEILQELDKPADKTLVIGDTEFDMQMAQSAGCDRIAVSYGVHDKVKLSPYSPLEMIHSPTELVQWFNVNMLHNDR